MMYKLDEHYVYDTDRLMILCNYTQNGIKFPMYELQEYLDECGKLPPRSYIGCFLDSAYFANVG